MREYESKPEQKSSKNKSSGSYPWGNGENQYVLCSYRCFCVRLHFRNDGYQPGFFHYAGKLFYDRLKSEPVNTEEELRNVVSFVNSISVRIDEKYSHSSISDTGREICVPGLLAQWELLDTRVFEMFIEDYDCLTTEEIGEYIYALCGVYPRDFSSLSQNEQKDALLKLTKKRWIAKNKLYDILGINRPRVALDSAEKKAAQKKDQGLSVWLL